MEQALFFALSAAFELMKGHQEQGKPMSPEAEAKWNEIIAFKEEALDKAAGRARPPSIG